MKQINFDEAGTDHGQHTAVVAAVIIDADKQFRAVENDINAAIRDHIPEELQDGFIFHAKDVFGKWKKQYEWDIPKCNSIIDAWIGIIRKHNLPVSLSWFAKPFHTSKVLGFEMNPDSSKTFENDSAHFMAFALNFQQCDDFIAQFYPDEVASALVEDCGHMRKYIRDMVDSLKSGELAKVLPSYIRGEITHIKNAVQFCSKKDAILIQLADVAAFSFKRYLHSNPGGERLNNLLMGIPPESRLAEQMSLAGFRLLWQKPD